MTPREQEIFKKFLKTASTKEIMGEVLHILIYTLPEFEKRCVMDGIEEYMEEK